MTLQNPLGYERQPADHVDYFEPTHDSSMFMSELPARPVSFDDIRSDEVESARRHAEEVYMTINRQSEEDRL